jgi:hypothetical protein
MSLLKLLEDEAQTLLTELKARCEHLHSAYDKNAHAHIDPLIDALQAHVDGQTSVEESVIPVEVPVVVTTSVVSTLSSTKPSIVS